MGYLDDIDLAVQNIDQSVDSSAQNAFTEGSNDPNVALANQQKADGVTGDQYSATTRTGNTISEMGGVATRWWDSTSKAFDNDLLKDKQGNAREFSDLSGGQQTAVVLRTASNVVGAAMSALAMPKDMLDVGFANLTAPIAAMFPSFPAATLGSLYVGMPHGHCHPPSYIPAPPTPGAVIPLPSIGSVAIGNHLKTLIGSMPAARCGDIGLAPTCCGFTPFFTIKLGSSNVFIGGKRAARMMDMCEVCHPMSPAAGAFATGMAVAGVAAGGLAIAADLSEAAVADEAATQSAKALSAAMNSAQMAADAVLMATQAAMGKDIAHTPGPGPAGLGPMPVAPKGAITLGNPMVLIGGFPMIDFPDPVSMLLQRLKALKAKRQDKKAKKNGPGPDD